MRRPRPARFPRPRRPSRRTIVVGGLALLTGVITYRQLAAAAAVTARYEDSLTAWVADHDIAAGDVIGSDDVSPRPWPRAFAPDDALADDPRGLVARVDVSANSVLSRSEIAGLEAAGAAALIPDRWSAIAIPVYDAAPPVRPGTRVHLYGVTSAVGVSSRLADNAVVVHVAEDGTPTVAVAPDLVARVVSALTMAPVTVVLAG